MSTGRAEGQAGLSEVPGRVLIATDTLQPAAADLAGRAAVRGGRLLFFSQDAIGGVRVKGRGTVEDAARLLAMLMPWPPLGER